jgi:NADP-dependent 3-hydroxy acid dehydrogenase YdfG
MAQALARAGARVALGGRDDDRLAQAIETIDTYVGEVRPVQIDVRDTASITRAVTALDDAWGGLDVLVNNAGLGMRTVTLPS